MPHRFSLSIIIPVFNGASTIPPLIKELCDIPITGALQIILVVDGSTDNSSQICRQLCDEFSTPISVIDLAKNFGEHNAILAGLSYADGDHIITMDDDLQNPVFEITRVWEYARNNQFDVVYTQYHKKMTRSGEKLAANLPTCALKNSKIYLKGSIFLVFAASLLFFPMLFVHILDLFRILTG